MTVLVADHCLVIFVMKSTPRQFMQTRLYNTLDVYTDGHGIAPEIFALRLSNKRINERINALGN